jgi:hypothetical protein
MRWSAVAAAAAILFTVNGCTVTKKYYLGGSAAGAATGAVSAADKIIGPTGGSVVNAEGDEVDVPPGDLASNTDISIGQGTPIQEPGFAPVGAPVECGPSGTKFGKPAQVTVKFDPASLPPGRSASDVVLVRRESSGQTTNLTPTSVDPATGKVTALTDSFSTFEPEVPSAPSATASAGGTLIMWYGVSTLDGVEDGMIKNFAEMETGLQGAQAGTITVVCQMSPTKAAYLGSTTAKRFLVKGGAGSSQVLQDLGASFDAVDPQALADFVSFAIKTYPAGRKVLILADHGLDWKGWGMDANQKQFTVATTEQALKTVTQDASLATPKLDIVAFDCCSMAGLEVDEMLAKYAAFRVSCEQPMYGYQYDKLLPQLVSSPAMATRDLANAMANTYFASFPRGTLTNKAECVSTVDLSQMPAVLAAVDAFAKALQGGPGSAATLGKLESARRAARSFKIYSNDPDPDLVDLAQLASNVAADPSFDPGTQQAAGAVAAAIAAATTANQTGADYAGAQGISVFFPTKLKPADASSYTTLGLASATAWPGFLVGNDAQRQATFANPSEQSAVSVSGSQNTSGPTPQAPAQVTLSVTNFDRASYVTKIASDNGQGQFVDLGAIDWGVAFSSAAPSFSWDGQLLTITDGNTTAPVGGAPQDPNNQDILWVPIAYTSQAGTSSSGAITIDRANAAVQGFFNVDGAGGAGMEAFEPQPGDTFTITYFGIDTTTNQPTQVPGTDTYTVGPGGAANIAVLAQPAISGSYVFRVDGEDPAGNRSSDSVAVTVP